MNLSSLQNRSSVSIARPERHEEEREDRCQSELSLSERHFKWRKRWIFLCTTQWFSFGRTTVTTMTDSIYQWKLIDFSLELKEMIFHFSFLSFLKIFSNTATAAIMNFRSLFIQSLNWESGSQGKVDGEDESRKVHLVFHYRILTPMQFSTFYWLDARERKGIDPLLIHPPSTILILTNCFFCFHPWIPTTRISSKREL